MKHEAGGGGQAACKGLEWQEVVALPTCQPYSQEDTIGYRNFSAGFCRFRSRRYKARPWPSWEMPWKSSCRVLEGTRLMSKLPCWAWPAGPGVALWASWTPTLPDGGGARTPLVSGSPVLP